MNIIEQGKLPKEPNKFHGQCSNCKTIIECYKDECAYNNMGEFVVRCPTLHCDTFICVKEGKYEKPWVDPSFKKKDWYITPTN